MEIHRGRKRTREDKGWEASSRRQNGARVGVAYRRGMRGTVWRQRRSPRSQPRTSCLHPRSQTHDLKHRATASGSGEKGPSEMQAQDKAVVAGSRENQREGVSVAWERGGEGRASHRRWRRRCQRTGPSHSPCTPWPQPSIGTCPPRIRCSHASLPAERSQAGKGSRRPWAAGAGSCRRKEAAAGPSLPSLPRQAP